MIVWFGEFLSDLRSTFNVILNVVGGVVLAGLVIGVVVTARVRNRRSSSFASMAPAVTGPAPDGVWFVRVLSGPARGTSGRFQLADGNLIFWPDFAAVQPTWAVKVSELGVYLPTVLGPPPGNIVLYADRAELACVVSKRHGADPQSGRAESSAELAHALSAEADSFTQELLALGATLLGRAEGRDS